MTELIRSPSKKILILGAYGQLGTQLQQDLIGFASIYARSHQEIDLTVAPSILRRQIEQIQPDVILNTSASNDVVKAESNKYAAYLINEASLSNLANICSLLDITLVHISTDYVFDGESRAPYHEDSLTNPLSVYGHSKRCGEIKIQASGCKHIIIRTSWLYSIHGENFANTIIRLLRQGKELNIVNDQLGTPTSALFLADVVKKILVCLFKDSNNQTFYGTFHCTPTGHTSWYGFATYLANNLKLKGIINPISTDNYWDNSPVRRPKYSTLCCNKISTAYNLNLETWQKSATKYCKEITLDNSIL